MVIKSLYKAICMFYFVCILALCLPAHAGWSESVRLTYLGGEISPQVVARNDTVHVVWNQMGYYTSYIRSTDGGVTWDSLINLTEEGHIGIYPDLSLSNNGLFVSWQDRDIFYTIGYSASEDGSTWSSPEYIYTDNLDDVFLPASSVKGDSIFITYWSLANDSTGMKPLRFLSSYDYGNIWNDEVTIGYPYSSQQVFLLKYCNGVLISVRAGGVENSNEYWHVVGHRSVDAGQTWSDMFWISPEDEILAQAPCFACNDETGGIAVGYLDHRYQEYAFHGDIFIAISTDGGQTWPREVQATFSHTAQSSDIDFISDTLIAVWSDRLYYEEGDHDIFYNRSNNGGLNWEYEERLINTPGLSTDPWTIAESGKVHLVWRDEDEGYLSDIYYKNHTSDTTIIVRDEANIPESLELSAYPSPFNSSLSINIESLSAGTLQVYDILGRVVREYDYVRGKNLISWDACDNEGKPVSSGVYFIKQKGINPEINIQKVVFLQ